jgi:uncharacterized repeat protein (TIGR04138 family)
MTLVMNFREELARVIAGDPRYAIDAYAFVLEALNHARTQKLKGITDEVEHDRSSGTGRAPRKSPAQSDQPTASGHVTGRELCETIRRLALRQYGSLAATVFAHWGVCSTSDIGDIVYNLIAAGDLEKTPTDSRSDFDNVFDFEMALKPKVSLKGRAAREDRK